MVIFSINPQLFLLFLTILFKYSAAQGTLSQSLCITIENTTLEEWNDIELTVKKVIADRITLLCNNQPLLCSSFSSINSTDSIIIYTVPDVLVHTDYPIIRSSTTNTTIQVALSVQRPSSTSSSTLLLLPLGTLLTIGDYIHSILNTLLVHRTVVNTEACQNRDSLLIDRSLIKDNTVVMTIGLTNLQHWNNDLSLQYNFKDLIATMGTQYCVQNSLQCAITNNSNISPFTTAHVIIQDNTLQEDTQNLQLNIGFTLNHPPTTNHTSLPLVPRDALVTIALQMVTPFFNRTGRPVTSISVIDSIDLTTVSISISIPAIIFLTIAIVSIFGYWILRKLERRQEQDLIPGPLENDTDTVQLISYRQIAD